MRLYTSIREIDQARWADRFCSNETRRPSLCEITTDPKHWICHQLNARHIFHSLLSNVLSNKYYHRENLTFLARCVTQAWNCSTMSHWFYTHLYRSEDENYRWIILIGQTDYMIYFDSMVISLSNQNTYYLILIIILE